jgi:glycosyltransferase involved in cell wall biosynthesis/MoaA/NifB/PqqE/SkfB family radical SAM enzyme
LRNLRSEQQIMKDWKGDLSSPLVSISCLAYNHERYIEDALGGFLMQKTDFPFEILIHDDASSDRTADVIREYEALYQNMIKPVYQTENQFSKKVSTIGRIQKGRVKGKYIAQCEGDDYWTDPHKLQKQVDFLESNPDCVMCYHNAKIIDENGAIIKNSKLSDDLKKDFSSEELIQGKMILTLTICYRNFLKELPHEYFKVLNKDKFFTSLLGSFGKGKYIADISDAVYRKHSAGIWSKLDPISQVYHNGVTRGWLHRYYKRIGQDKHADYFKNELINHFNAVLQKIVSLGDNPNEDIVRDIFTNYTDIIPLESERQLRELLNLIRHPFKARKNKSNAIGPLFEKTFGCQKESFFQKNQSEKKIARCGGNVHLLNDLMRIDWILTRRCNYKCSYCTVYDNVNGFFPPLEELKKAADSIAKLPNSNIILQLAGGEPTIHPNYLEFVDYLSNILEGRALIKTLTNLGLPSRFFKNVVSRLKKNRSAFVFYPSFHFDHADKNEYVEKVKQLTDNGFAVNIQLMAHPLYMNDVKSLYYDLSTIKNKLLNTHVVMVRQDFGVLPDKRYSKKDLEWFQSTYKDYEVKSMFFDYLDEENCQLIREEHTPDEIMAYGLNRYKGMICNAGINFISINANGDIDPAVCFRKVNKVKPNIYKSANAIFELPKAIVCPFDACGCPADQLIIKYSPELISCITPRISFYGGDSRAIKIQNTTPDIIDLKESSDIISSSPANDTEGALTINWVITRKCNYTCTYCTVKDNKNGFFHDIASLKSAIDKISLIGKENIKFIITGGEPTICPNYIDFMEYIFQKLGTRAKIATITNLSMPLSFFEKVRTSLHQYLEKISFIASFHFEHADRQQFIEKVKFISRNGILIKTQILAHPKYMHVTQRLFNELNQTSNEKSKIDVKIVRENFGPDPDKRYSKQDLDWLKQFYKESENEEVNLAFLTDNHKIENLKLSANELITYDLNRFKGFECYAGIESISINANGEIDPAVCFRGAGYKKSNIFTDENPFISFKKPILCPFEKCGCLADLLLQKKRPDYDKLIKSLTTSADAPLEYWLNKKGWQGKKELYSVCFESVTFQKDVNKPDISVIVISWRLHPDNLKNFQILEKQRDQNFELIFVDNGGKEGEFDCLKPFVDTYVRLNKNTGAYLARNVGAVFAKAPILLFLEDDGIPKEDLVSSHLQMHKIYDVIVCRGVYSPKTNNPLNRLARHYYLGPEVIPIFADLEGNVTYQSDLFYIVGGWDDEIKFGGGGLELSLRLSKLNPDLRKQIYSPLPIIYHDFARDESHLKSKREKQNLSRIRLRKIHPNWDNYISKYIDFSQKFRPLLKNPTNQENSVLISICIPTYNRAEYIDEAIQCVLAQTYQNFEIIVVDDGSIDDTATLVNRINDKRIRYLKKTHSGRPETRNLLIEKARGEYILWLDDDDLLDKQVLEKYMNVLENYPDTDVVYGNLSAYQGDISNQTTIFEAYDYTSNNRSILKNLVNGSGITFGGSIMRKELLERYGCFDPAYMRAQDFELWTRIAPYAKFHKVNEIVYYYRQHGKNVSVGNIVDMSYNGMALRGLMNRYPLETIFPDLDWSNKQKALNEAHRELAMNLYRVDDLYHVLQYLDYLDSSVNKKSEYHNLRINTYFRMGRWDKLANYSLPQSFINYRQKLDEIKRYEFAGNWDHYKQAVEALYKIESVHTFDSAFTVFKLFKKLGQKETADKWLLTAARLNPEKHFSLEIEIEYQKMVKDVRYRTMKYNPVEFQRLDKWLGNYPLVSVIIPTHNRPEKLKVAIQSVLDQTYPSIEIIVSCDDGKKEAEAVVQAFNDSRIKYTEVPVNSGPPVSRNAAFQLAQGDYCAFLDDDDIYYTEHLLTAMRHIDEKTAVVYTDATRVTWLKEEGKYRQIEKRIPYSFDFDRNALLVGNITPINCVVFKHSLARAMGYFDENLFTLEDWDFWIRLSKLTPFKHLKVATAQVNWYVDGTTITSSMGKRAQQSRAYIYKKHLKEMQAVPNRDEIMARFNKIWSNDFNVNVFLKKRYSSRPLVSIIILTYNQLEYTKKCLESIAANTPEPHEIIIVDNGSTDGTVQWLRNLAAENSNYRLIENKENLGFALGNNKGIAEAKGDYVVLMNNDVVVTPGWLKRLVKVAKRKPQVGIVGPMSNYVSGPQFVKEVTYKKTSLVGLSKFSKTFARKHAGQTMPYWRVVGFCMLIKREVIDKIGGLDGRFGLGNFEDDDFSLRAALAGFESWIVKDCFVHHFGSRTFAGAKIDFRESLHKNWEIFKEKWGIPSDVAYGASYDMGAVVRNGFIPEKHYCPLSDKEYISPYLNKEQEDTDAAHKMYQNAQMLVEKGMDNAAIMALGKLLESYPDFALAHNDLGVLYYKAGKKEDAFEHYKKAAELQPENINFQKNLADFYYVELGKVQEAIEIYVKTLALDPRDIECLLMLGHISVSIEKIDDAKVFYMKVLEVDPNNADARQNLDSIQNYEQGTAV